MLIEPLSLEHQTLLENKFHRMNLSLAEYSFANLYLFRKLHQYQVLQVEKDVFIKGKTRDKVPFIMLTSPPEEIPLSSLTQAFSQGEILFPIPENWLNFFEKMSLQATFKEEDNDYLYDASKLGTYAGRHLNGQRNLVKHLIHQYEVKSEDFSDQFEDAQAILKHWSEDHLDNMETDALSCQEAIQLFHRLHLHGRIAYANQQPAAFVIGEWISKECYAIHFSKALRSIKGIYQYLFQDLAHSIADRCKWINFEQDLGIPALRYSKLSYDPQLILKKWRIAKGNQAVSA